MYPETSTIAKIKRNLDNLQIAKKTLNENNKDKQSNTEKTKART